MEKREANSQGHHFILRCFFEDLIGFIEQFMNQAASHLATRRVLPHGHHFKLPMIWRKDLSGKICNKLCPNVCRLRGQQIFLLPAEGCLPATRLWGPGLSFAATGSAAPPVAVEDMIAPPHPGWVFTSLSGWVPGDGRDNRKQALGPFSFLKRSSVPH